MCRRVLLCTNWKSTTKNLLSLTSLLADMMLPLVCQLGDQLINTAQVQQSTSLPAVLDSMMHGIVGGLSWVVVLGSKVGSRAGIKEVLLAALLACLLDVDHFFMAGSWKLEDALNLPSRPPFHNTAVIPVIGAGIYILQRIFQLEELHKLPLLFSLSWLSHQVRDAHRRGLWIGLVWTSSPLPGVVYLGLITLMPWIFRCANLRTHAKEEKSCQNTNLVNDV